MNKISISEIYGPVVQGEGALIGRPTLFVRVGGCDYRCSWCDSLYAVMPKYKPEWTLMSPVEVLGRLRQLASPPILVTLSGGNPALFDGVGELVIKGRVAGYEFAMETQGSACKPWFTDLHHLILSPKPPSSGMPTDWDVLDQCLEAGYNCRGGVSVKVVVSGEADYLYAKQVCAHVQRRFTRDRADFYLQACNTSIDSSDVSGEEKNPARLEKASSLALYCTSELQRMVLDDGWFDVTVLPQLQVLLHGNQRGV